MLAILCPKCGYLNSFDDNDDDDDNIEVCKSCNFNYGDIEEESREKLN